MPDVPSPPVAFNGAASDGVPGSTDAPPSGRYSTFSSLRYRNFRYLWLGQISHAGALWMEQLARPVLIWELTGSGAHMGGVVAMRTLPQLFFGVWAGVVSDWFDRRRVLLIDKVGVLILNIIFAALIVTGNLEIWHIYLVSFLRGTMMAFDQPARQSLIPTVVPQIRVTNAVALMSATQNTMRIMGAASAGFVIAAFGVEGAFIIIPIIYVGAVFFTYKLDVPHVARTGRRTARGAFVDLKEGAVFAWGHPAIRGVLLLSLVYFTFGMSYMQVFAPLFALDVLDIGSGGLGIMLTITGVGALAAALFIANRQPTRLGLILPAVVITFGALLISFSIATYLPRPLGLLLPLGLLAVVGSLQTSYFSLSNAMLLHAAPEHMRGRVISLLSLDRAMVTGGAAVAGFLADAIGVQVAQIIYAAIVIVGTGTVFTLNSSFRSVTTSGAFRLSQAAGLGGGGGRRRMTDGSPPPPAPAVAALAAPAQVAAPAAAGDNVAAAGARAREGASGAVPANGGHGVVTAHGANGAREGAPSNGSGAIGTNGANGTNGDAPDEPVGPPARYAPRVRRDYMRAGVILGRDYTQPPHEDAS